MVAAGSLQISSELPEKFGRARKSRHRAEPQPPSRPLAARSRDEPRKTPGDGTPRPTTDPRGKGAAALGTPPANRALRGIKKAEGRLPSRLMLEDRKAFIDPLWAGAVVP